MSETREDVFRALLRGWVGAHHGLRRSLAAKELEAQWLDRWEKAEPDGATEAVARDFAIALCEARHIIKREFGPDPLEPWDFIDEALARHPGFLEDE